MPNRKSGGCPASTAARILAPHVILRWLDELDLLAGLLLEGGDDLPDRLVLLGVAALLPPHHEVGGPGAERRQDQRRGERTVDEPLHGRHSARICLIRAIASSTACSGLMPSAATRWTALPQTYSRLTSDVSRIAGGDRIPVGARAGQELDRRGHVMPVARVEPERLVEQLRHRRQQALAGEVEIMREPALLHEEAHELLGQGDVSARLEGRRRIEAGPDGERLAVGAIRPFDRRRVLVVVLRPLALERVGDRERAFAVMTTAWARNAWLFPRLSQSTESGGVQPLR